MPRRYEWHILTVQPHSFRAKSSLHVTDYASQCCRVFRWVMKVFQIDVYSVDPRVLLDCLLHVSVNVILLICSVGEQLGMIAVAEEHEHYAHAMFVRVARQRSEVTRRISGNDGRDDAEIVILPRHPRSIGVETHHLSLWIRGRQRYARFVRACG